MGGGVFWEQNCVSTNDQFPQSLKKSEYWLWTKYLERKWAPSLQGVSLKVFYFDIKGWVHSPYLIQIMWIICLNSILVSVSHFKPTSFISKHFHCVKDCFWKKWFVYSFVFCGRTRKIGHLQKYQWQIVQYQSWKYFW